MKVVVAGGYGVFGSRLADLLVRDGHDVVIAGRDLVKAQDLASRLGCTAQATDLRANPAALFDTQPDVVVDAAGPYQAYGDDPYRIACLCIDNGAEYIDLSDDARFTEGLSRLDGPACAAGRRLLSGVSSVPAISSSIAAELCAGFEEVMLIDTAILPGNRAPRGASVIASIIGQLGGQSCVWRGGVWRKQFCWSDARRISLATGLERTGRFIEVPDVTLFPERFKSRSVVFRAGMELGVLNAAMSVLARVRRYWPFQVTARKARLFRWIANLFLPFGTDRGGMRVLVVGSKKGAPVRREWRLVAEAGDGPYMPAVAARAVLRNLDRIAPGARPCLAEVSRADIEAAMTDLDVSTETEDGPAPTLFQSALADRWANLPEEVRDLHGVQDVESFSGTAEVSRGTSAVARLAAWFFGFPPAAPSIPLTVTMTRTDDGEMWERNFDGHVFRSYCTPSPETYRYRERFWLFNFEQDLSVEDSSMRLPVRRGWFAGIPIPRLLLPTSESREYVKDGIFHFDVALGAPLGGGLIVHYRGQLRPDRIETGASSPSRPGNLLYDGGYRP
ncbi:MAG: DUF4166 domain-containing protein [Woeseiaceae bacterium]|nr:DUF4166 domain-containing protein [Woeseiaceae bacterium]